LASWIAILSLPAAYCLLILSGCNSKLPGDNSKTPPKLSIGEGQGTDTGGQRPNDQLGGMQADSSNSAAAPTQANPSTDPKQQADPELEAVLNQLETNAKAWQEGKPFDFAPSATKIVERLQTNFNQTQLELAHDAAQLFIMAGAYDDARQVYTALATAAEKASDSKLAPPAQEIAQAGLTKLNLLNSSPIVEGTLFGGGQFDWSAYRGKVVLIDFWATWCPHCVEELPEVKQIYEKFHDQGFDVVGISLDEDKKALADFLDKKQLPWVTLFSDDPAKQGWEGAAMSKAFAVEELPTMILIDRSGKIVSIFARGEVLPQLVEKVLAEK
jgi:peroxiredoxin